MAINTIKATMQMRRGAEQHFDPDQMTAGEWAVSTDSKKVWMCFSPGIVRRMATYEAFEQDMEEIHRLLATCQNIREAVEAFEELAEQHKNDAANSAQAAAGSASSAGISEINAAGSATSAAGSAQAATDSAADAKDSEDAAKISEDNAAASAVTAEESKEAAAGSAQAAAGSAEDAKASEDAAEASAGQSEDYSLMSKSYAVGTDGQVRPGDPTDNSKYYSDLAQYLTDEAAKLLDQAQKLISAATAGALIPSGTVAFENLPTEPQVGYMYNISNAFVTDDRFAEGPGIQYNPGANVYWTRDGQWDVMIGVQVTGVKGAAESFYRQGNVDITPANIGLGNVPNVGTNDQTPTFTQAATRENIASGNKLSVILGKIMKWFADLKAVAFSGSYTDLSNKPTALKNPSALTFTGAVTGSYDGSAAKSVAIPTSLPANGGTAETISGILPITRGGTGQTNVGAAFETLVGGARAEPEDYGFVDNDSIIWVYSGNTGKQVYKTKFLKLWNYIRGKTDALYAKYDNIYFSSNMDSLYPIPFYNNINVNGKNEGKLHPMFSGIKYNSKQRCVILGGLTIPDYTDGFDGLKFPVKFYWNHATNWAGIGAMHNGSVMVKVGTTEENQMQYCFGHKNTHPGILIRNNTSAFVIHTNLDNNIMYLGANSQVRCKNVDLTNYVPIGASSFNVNSSIRYKENVQNMTEEEADKILDLRPVSYDYKAPDNRKDCFGMIAEEVDKVIPFAVTYDQGGMPDSLDYSKFVPHLIKMVQMLKKENNNLKSRLDRIETTTGYDSR